MKIFYWSPFLSNIATIDAVINSVKSIIKYDKKKKLDPIIIDSSGEWLTQKNKIENLNILKLYKKDYYKFLLKRGFIQSRMSQLLIFIISFFKLKKVLKREKPDYLLAHLIISLPLILFYFYNFQTKLVLRISGTPKLNFIRKFFWSKFSKNVEHVICPTRSTFNTFKKLNIFPISKLKLLYDPIISINRIAQEKKKKIESIFNNKEYILSIGRLTRQKNFSLLINSFREIKKKLPNINLVILGEGEERKKLENQIINLDLKKSVYLLGYRSNVFNYIYNSKCYISSSLHEDPGFSLIEAGSLNKIIIAFDSKTGPSELIDGSRRGFLFTDLDSKSLTDTFFDFYKCKDEIINLKKVELKKYIKNFTLFSHYKKLDEIFIK